MRRGKTTYLCPTVWVRPTFSCCRNWCLIDPGVLGRSGLLEGTKGTDGDLLGEDLCWRGR